MRLDHWLDLSYKQHSHCTDKSCELFSSICKRANRIGDKSSLAPLDVYSLMAIEKVIK